MATEREARLVLSARDRTAPAFAAVRARLAALGRQAGLQRISRQLGNVKNAMGGVARQARALRRVGLGVAGLAGAFGLSAGAAVAMAKRYADTTDELAKFSRQIGLSVQDMRELRFVAERQGVSQQLLDTSLLALSKRVGELKGGYGQLNSLLKKTNPELLEQIRNSKGTAEAFDLIMQAAAGMADETERNAFMAAAFSRSGIAMGRIAEAGADGMAALRGEARKLLGVMGQASGKQAEEFVDAWTNVRTALQGVQDAIGEKLLPTLTPLLESLKEWIARNRDLVASRVGRFVRDFARWLRRIDWREVGRGLRDFGRGLRDVGRMIGRVVDAVGGARNALLLLAGVTLAPLALSLGRVVFELGRLAAVIATTPIGAVALAAAGAAWLLWRNWDRVGPAVERAGERAREAGGQLREAAAALGRGDFAGAGQGIGGWADRMTQAFRGALDAVHAFNRGFDELTGLDLSWIDRLETQTFEAMSNLGGWIRDLTQPLQDLEDMMTGRIGRAFDEVFGEEALGNAASAVRRMFDGLVADVSSLPAQIGMHAELLSGVWERVAGSWRPALDGLRRLFAGLVADVGALPTQIGRPVELLLGVWDGLAESWRAALEGVKAYLKSWADWFRATFVSPILNAADAVKRAFDSLPSGTPAKGLPSVSDTGELSGSVPGRASGGPVLKDRLYWIGERGRELFAPGRSGMIIPNAVSERLAAAARAANDNRQMRMASGMGGVGAGGAGGLRSALDVRIKLEEGRVKTVETKPRGDLFRRVELDPGRAMGVTR